MFASKVTLLPPRWDKRLAPCFCLNTMLPGPFSEPASHLPVHMEEGKCIKWGVPPASHNQFVKSSCTYPIPLPSLLLKWREGLCPSPSQRLSISRRLLSIYSPSSRTSPFFSLVLPITNRRHGLPCYAYKVRLHLPVLRHLPVSLLTFRTKLLDLYHRHLHLTTSYGPSSLLVCRLPPSLYPCCSC